MILTIARVLALFLSALAITKTYHDLKKGKESVIMAAFWIILWFIIFGTAVYPDLVNLTIQKSRGQGVGIGTFIGMILVFLVYLIYRTYEKAQRLEVQLRDMVAKLGLKDIEEK